jgi:hypothetical protein
MVLANISGWSVTGASFETYKDNERGGFWFPRMKKCPDGTFFLCRLLASPEARKFKDVTISEVSRFHLPLPSEEDRKIGISPDAPARNDRQGTLLPPKRLIDYAGRIGRHHHCRL